MLRTTHLRHCEEAKPTRQPSQSSLYRAYGALAGLPRRCAPRNDVLYGLLALYVSVIASVAWAEPSLEEKQKELNALQHRIAESQKKIESIQKDASLARQDMEVLENSIGDITEDLKSYEREYRKIDKSLKALEKQKAGQEAALQAQREQVAGMLSASIRLSQTPELAVLVIPQDASTRVTAARALGLTAISLRDDMEVLAKELRTLEVIENNIAAKKERLGETQAELNHKKARLKEAIGERQATLKSLSKEDEQQRQSVAKLQRQSKDLGSLVNSLEKARTQYLSIGTPVAKPQPPGKTKKMSGQKPSRPITTAKGHLRLPATGTLTGNYGDRRGANNTLKGLEISTVPSAVVTAPYDGEVLFTGKFLDYGNIVILRHSNSYHTLLAGLAQIQCLRGQTMSQGAPVGMMGQAAASRRLYVEFRQNSKPVDPASWYQGMSRLAKRE